MTSISRSVSKSEAAEVAELRTLLSRPARSQQARLRTAPLPGHVPGQRALPLGLPGQRAPLPLGLLAHGQRAKMPATKLPLSSSRGDRFRAVGSTAPLPAATDPLASVDEAPAAHSDAHERSGSSASQLASVPGQRSTGMNDSEVLKANPLHGVKKMPMFVSHDGGWPYPPFVSNADWPGKPTRRLTLTGQQQG